MDIYEKFCPVCKNKNEKDATVCRYCGAWLEAHPVEADGITRNAEPPTPDGEILREWPTSEAAVPANGIAIYLESVTKPVFLSSDQEFVIGRKTGETSGKLLDLSPFGGYHLGVSRRHVLLRRTDAGYDAIDLASSNGTWLNDERLIPNLPYPVVSGSQLRLARMRFFVLFRTVAETRQKS